MMEARYTKLLINQAEVILKEAEKLKGQGIDLRYEQGRVSYKYYLDQIDLLIKQYNFLFPKVNKLLEKENITEILGEVKPIEGDGDKIRNGTIYNSDKKILQLIFGSSNILCFLREGVVLPDETRDRLLSLSEELKTLAGEVYEEVYLNLELSKESFEKGCFLGSSLISGKIINVCLNEIPGDINEKIKILKEKKLIEEKGGVDSIIRASHFGRNLTSHELKINPTSSEAISSLSDAIRVSKIISRYKNSLKINSI